MCSDVMQVWVRAEGVGVQMLCGCGLEQRECARCTHVLLGQNH